MKSKSVNQILASQEREIISQFIQGNIEEEDLRRILSIKEKGRTAKPKKEGRYLQYV